MIVEYTLYTAVTESPGNVAGPRQYGAAALGPLEASVTTHRTATRSYDTKMTWRKIYSNPDLYSE